jgi:hypothetical protein
MNVFEAALALISSSSFAWIGRYRRRRFAAFDVLSGAVTRKPHQPHYQSRDYNTLNGGIEGWFTPVSDSVAANGLTRGINDKLDL